MIQFKCHNLNSDLTIPGYCQQYTAWGKLERGWGLWPRFIHISVSTLRRCFEAPIFILSAILLINLSEWPRRVYRNLILRYFWYELCLIPSAGEPSSWILTVRFSSSGFVSRINIRYFHHQIFWLSSLPVHLVID